MDVSSGSRFSLHSLNNQSSTCVYVWFSRLDAGKWLMRAGIAPAWNTTFCSLLENQQFLLIACPCQRRRFVLKIPVVVLAFESYDRRQDNDKAVDSSEGHEES